jgi:CubicO group peptidase (beta-lactamase class C family)
MNSYCGRSRNAALLIAALASAAMAQDRVDRVVERARSEFDVPGIAVAIVKDGKVVLAKGYGVRRIGRPEKVTEHSLFRIASNTKAFTAAALGILVDEGKIHWNDRVVDLMPSFQMYDPYATHEMTVTDLLVHRSGMGLGEGDLMFFPPSDLSREEIIRRLRFLKPATSFRSGYAYDNLLYLVAGTIIPSVTGTSWDDFVKARIFVPLHMSNSFINTQALEAAADVAMPHSKLGGKMEVLPHENVDNNAPAGSISSCVADLAQWMMLQLGGGKLGDLRLFSEKQSREMWSPKTILPIEPSLPVLQPSFFDYGLGWFLRDYRGKKMVYHTGSLAGYVSRTTLIPELKLGVVVLTNAEEDAAHEAIAFSIVDQYLGAPETDWAGSLHELAKQEAARMELQARSGGGSRNASSRPPLPLDRYAGRYRDAWYGDVTIEQQAGKLVIRFTHTPALLGDLEHWQYDTFVARWRNRTLGADAYVTFSLNPDGSIEEVKMKPVSPATDFSFDFQDLLLKPVPRDSKPM